MDDWQPGSLYTSWSYVFLYGYAEAAKWTVSSRDGGGCPETVQSEWQCGSEPSSSRYLRCRIPNASILDLEGEDDEMGLERKTGPRLEH